MSNTVNIKRAQQDIEKLILDTEKLEDKGEGKWKSLA